MTRSVAGGIDAVIFDMDGVLVDSEPLNFEAVRRLLARHGIAYAEDDNAAFIGMTDREHMRVLKIQHRLAPAEDRLVEDYLELVLSLIPGGTRPMPGVPEVLLGIGRAGYRLAVASSAAPPVIAARLDALGVRPLFEVVASGVEVPRGKPEPDVFLEAARRLGVSPRRCVVVEDSQNGLRAAKAAGMTCVVVPCRSTAGQDFSGADFRLEALTGLLGILNLAGRPGAGRR